MRPPLLVEEGHQRFAHALPASRPGKPAAVLLFGLGPRFGLPGLDFSKIGVFSGDNSGPIMEIINMSPKNQSVFRGTISIVGPAINGVQMDLPVATYQALLL